MTDGEMLLNLLKKIGVDASIKPDDDARYPGSLVIEVTEHGQSPVAAGDPPVFGYGNGSTVEFYLDEAGNLVGMAIWE